MTEHELNYYGVELIVKGNYSPLVWGGWDEMPEPSRFEIEKVMICDQNANDLLEEHMNTIEELILETYYS